MSSDVIYDNFLAAQFEQGSELARSSDRLNLIPVHGRPPTHYIAEFRCTGLVRTVHGEIGNHEFWAVGIHFPADYLRRRVEVPQVLTYLGPATNPWHPNIRPPFICVEITPGMPLVEILFALYDLITWNLYSTSDEGLNHAAAQWSRHEDAQRFPVDRRPLRRPSPVPAPAA